MIFSNSSHFSHALLFSGRVNLNRRSSLSLSPSSSLNRPGDTGVHVFLLQFDHGCGFRSSQFVQFRSVFVHLSFELQERNNPHPSIDERKQGIHFVDFQLQTGHIFLHSTARRVRRRRRRRRRCRCRCRCSGWSCLTCRHSLLDDSRQKKKYSRWKNRIQ